MHWNRNLMRFAKRQSKIEFPEKNIGGERNSGKTGMGKGGTFLSIIDVYIPELCFL